ncbi:MAG: CoA ester lyase [Candidatus Izemoplasmatales bacterium]|nr:CoA ester lyase [Candidatus Izemoplasmatales bacterium]
MFRSLLFIPGNNPSMLQNADVFLADAIIFDLEDAISINEKNNARNLVKNYLVTSSVLPNQVILRVNSINTEWFKKDIELLKTNKIDYLLIPKLDKLNLLGVEEYLNSFEKDNNLEETKIIALVETARGVNDLPLFAENKRIIALMLGAEDLASDLQIKRTETGEEIFYARSKIIYAAVDYNLIAIDTPYTNINNLEGLIKDATYAANLGMKAKVCIHPNQLEVVNKVFSPSEQEIKWAKEVIKISQEKPGSGAFQFQGKMIDKPILDRAEKILVKAKQFNLM